MFILWIILFSLPYGTKVKEHVQAREYLKLILHRFSQYTSHTHLHILHIYPITCSNTLYISVCNSLLFINGRKSVNEQTQKITHYTVTCFRLCSLSHSYPARVSAGWTCIDRPARAYCCSPPWPRVCVGHTDTNLL